MQAMVVPTIIRPRLLRGSGGIANMEFRPCLQARPRNCSATQQLLIEESLSAGRGRTGESATGEPSSLVCSIEEPRPDGRAHAATRSPWRRRRPPDRQRYQITHDASDRVCCARSAWTPYPAARTCGSRSIPTRRPRRWSSRMRPARVAFNFDAGAGEGQATGVSRSPRSPAKLRARSATRSA